MEYTPRDLTGYINRDVAGALRRTSALITSPLGEITTHAAAVVISEADIKTELARLACALGDDYRSRNVDRLVVVNVLEGATSTYKALVSNLRSLDESRRPIISEDALRVSRYGGHVEGRDLTMSHEPRINARGRHILVVEDLVDEGATADWLLRFYDAQKPASLRMVSLAQKPGKCQYGLTTDRYDFHAAINVGHHWLAGYGMDLSFTMADQNFVLYRDLPFVVAADPIFLERVGQLNAEKAHSLQLLLEKAA